MWTLAHQYRFGHLLRGNLTVEHCQLDFVLVFSVRNIAKRESISISPVCPLLSQEPFESCNRLTERAIKLSLLFSFFSLSLSVSCFCKQHKIFVRISGLDYGIENL